ncbi:MAG: AAA family ATPase [Desulfococcaceae bacterium]
MKFPYGIADFNAVITEDYYYCDRSDRIPSLERMGKYLLFIRPRRFGKSLLVSMLHHYYDILQKDRFDTLFGGLAAGKNPTPERNRFLILKWDFSWVDPTGGPDRIRRSLHDHINVCIEHFCGRYREILEKPTPINWDNALVSIKHLLSAVQRTGHPLYLLIDEYDNFANEVLTLIQDENDVYTALVHQNGPLKTLFKGLKSAAGEGLIERMFITGVSPVVLSDITSGYNIAENIYLRAVFNDLCGFTENEVRDMLMSVAKECGFEEAKAGDALNLMRTYYNGYCFSPGAESLIYNPTLAIYFAKFFQEDCKYPRKMLDANLATDEAKLEYAAEIAGGREMLLHALREDGPLTVSDISDRFGVRDMLEDESQDHVFTASFLYYFGVLTITGDTPDGELILRVPNLVVRGMYVDKIRRMLLPNPMERDDGRFAAKKVYQKGDMAPLCDFMENRFFKVFHNPDYRWANELTVKTAFLMLLYNDILYIMDSEREIGRSRADLTMIIRPDMRHYEIFDVVIEFKFVPLKAAGISGEQAKNLSPEELQEIPAMASEMKIAREQAARYGDELEQKYGNLRLRRYAVVSLGFERIWWEEVEKPGG